MTAVDFEIGTLAEREQGFDKVLERMFCLLVGRVFGQGSQVMLHPEQQLNHLSIMRSPLYWIRIVRKQVNVCQQIDGGAFRNRTDLDAVIVHERWKPAIPESQHRLESIGEIAGGHAKIAGLGRPVNAPRDFVDGRDCRAGQNCNAIILEMPHSFITPATATNRVVNAWGESWVRKAAHKVESIPDAPSWLEHPWQAVRDKETEDEELKKYKLVDTDGQPFADAALSERENDRQLGANNFWLGPHFIKRLAHLGWGFGPSISALGLKTSFDHNDSPVSVYKTYDLVATAFPRVAKTLFQKLNMPDSSWNPKGLPIPLRRPFEIFIPNVCAVDMDTNGSWPFGRRLEDQVATRFLALFLDMEAEWNGKKYHVDLLGEQALWHSAPIVPKTPPNPLKNDKEFLDEFPFLAEPWPEKW